MSGYDEETELLEYETEQQDAPVTVDPVRVEVCGPVLTVETTPQHATAYSIVLTSATPVAELLPLDALRKTARILALTNSVVICHSQRQAQDTANADPTLALPNGFVAPNGLIIPLETTQQMFVAAATFPTRVSVLVERRTT